MMSQEKIQKLQEQLSKISLIKNIPDESAYYLYQIAGVLFDWFVQENKHKLTRYLMHCHNLEPLQHYDPQMYYYDDIDQEEEIPF